MRLRTVAFRRDFRPLFANARGQVAEMTIAPGDREGGPDNRHVGADQWLFVVEGQGTAVVDGRRHRLRRHSLLLIGAGERHEIRNTGDEPLQTLNFYTPPVYDDDGEPLPRGRKRAD